MDRYRVKVEFTLPAAPEHIVEHLGFTVLDALHEMDGVADADLVGSLVLGHLAIEYVIKAANYADAQVKAAAFLQRALSATPGEEADAEPEGMIEETSTTIREIAAV
jgi:hypothetical protein